MCSNIDGPQGYYAKLNKTESYTEKDLYDLYDLTYMLNLLIWLLIWTYLYDLYDLTYMLNLKYKLNEQG